MTPQTEQLIRESKNHNAAVGKLVGKIHCEPENSGHMATLFDLDECFKHDNQNLRKCRLKLVA